MPMKKLIAFLLAALMLLSACGAPADTTVNDETDTPETPTHETEPPEPVERVDHAIPVLGDTYVYAKETSSNFGDAVDIQLKKIGEKLNRNGYLKFDISSLVGDNDFTSIELDLTMVLRQYNTGNPKYATVSIYGCESNWEENSMTFSTQPVMFSCITQLTDVTNEKITRSYPVTDYVRQVLAAGMTEIAFAVLDETPEMGLHMKLASKEAGENAPRLSVYYGTKTDDAKYEGDISLSKPEVSESGLDSILGFETVTSSSIEVLEDTYVQGGSDSNANFGSADMLDFKCTGSGITNLYRITLLKFDVSTLEKNDLTKAEIVLNCFSSQTPTEQRDINVYACDPYSWEEMTVTMNTRPQKEEHIITIRASAKGIIRINVTDYVKKALENGEQQVAFYLEGSPDSALRMSFDSSEKEGGIAPTLDVKCGELSFNTYLEYTDVNPWEKAMADVTEWLERWETIKKGGNPDATEIAVDKSEYPLLVDACLSSKTNGASTAYSGHYTRLIDTLNGYEANFDETALYDEYGGYMGDGKYGEATGYFYSKKVGDRWWTIDPLGYPFYRVACVQITHGSSPDQKKLTLAKYGDVAAWADSATDRVRELGFNSCGGWSDIDNLSKVEQPLAQTKVLSVLSRYASSKGLNTSSGAGTDLYEGVLPVFDPEFESFADEWIKSSTAGYENSPYIYGWMSDNELPCGWEMLENSLALDSTDKRLVYSYATAWTFMYLKTGKLDVSTADVTEELRDEYRAMSYDKYMKVVKTNLDKHVPNHMYIGCRIASIGYRVESLMRVMGYWCDVISFNYYGHWTPEKDLLCNLEKWSDAPFIVTEWYAKGMDVWEADNRMINKSGAGWTVRNQADRGKFYHNFALGLMEWKQCLGFDWFKYWDNDPGDSTADASNRDANKGIYSNSGEEYTDLTDCMAELNNQKYALIKFFDGR